MKQPAGDSSSYQLGLTLEPEQPRPLQVPKRLPLARSSDPVTSHQAVEQITRSGHRASLNQSVLAFLRSSGEAFTYRELAARIGETDAVSVMRRLNDLRRSGSVEKCGERNCSINGNLMTLWRAR
jgi:hypothetical protein